MASTRSASRNFNIRGHRISVNEILTSPPVREPAGIAYNLRINKPSRNNGDYTKAYSVAEELRIVSIGEKNVVGSTLALYDARKMKDVSQVNKFILMVVPSVILGAFPAAVSSQGFFEYGRAVGSVPHGQGITGGKVSGGAQQGGSTVGGIGDVGGRALPTRLVVSAKTTGLYPSQDEETEKIEQLSQGDALSPMVQSAGNNSWYMVKTSKGTVGWVKGADVREETNKK